MLPNKSTLLLRERCGAENHYHLLFIASARLLQDGKLMLLRAARSAGLRLYLFYLCESQSGRTETNLFDFEIVSVFGFRLERFASPFPTRSTSGEGFCDRGRVGMC